MRWKEGMYKIFCIPESSYLNAFYQYTKEGEYDGDRVRTFVYRTELSPKLVSCSGFQIVHSQDEFKAEFYNRLFFIRQHFEFTSLNDITAFVKQWFSTVFLGVYKDKQFRSDAPYLYANSNDFELPIGSSRNLG